MFITYLAEAPVFYFTVVTAVLVSVVLHELGHGFAAIRQGDETPRLLGHITLDPHVHMGTMGLIFLFVFGIAFGSMPVDPSRFKSRYGRAIVAFAGPAVNLVLAAIGIVVAGLWIRFAGVPEAGFASNLLGFFEWLAILNLILALFNLLPIPPLDGATVLGDLVPGYQRFASNPGNQPIFMGAFILVFLTAWRFLFPAAQAVVSTAVGWIV